MKKKPITTEIIKNILDVYSKEDANLKDLLIAALCSLAFAGFFRYDELCSIVPKHIEFCSGYIRIFLPRSKTDIYREGNCVYISGSKSKYCPVGVLRSYLDLSGIDVCSTLPLFRPLVFHRGNRCLIITMSSSVVDGSKFISPHQQHLLSKVVLK